MSITYHPASDDERAELRAAGNPLADAADLQLPDHPEELDRMRHELLTAYAPATTIDDLPRYPGLKNPRHLTEEDWA